ncbi:Sterigmatocystin 8-O-methyltransferase [Sphaceloma murrayae]|uniref:Sterigmatocystin 8-O-methyltransferase n=1 Tax=Sphaceloma murrayae TaxID=2082308 RepID=A0A2K1QLB7_9PEZI|nr:Sterigmatocystin 8-O-methyltransferase [Sphaceloma murrayae]
MALRKAEGAKYFLSLTTEEAAMSATGMYQNMIEEQTKHGFSDRHSPFGKQVSKDGCGFFEYLGKPEGAAALNKVINGRITRPALIHDYPWADLKDSRVVDVGCGPGDAAMDILRLNKTLRWCFQDLPPAIDQVKKAIPEDLKDAVERSQITFQEQDYFKENVSEGDVWFMRGVLREYDDEQATAVLQKIAQAMTKTPGCKLLINEIVCGSATIARPDEVSKPPSATTPREQALWSYTGNLMACNACILLGGKERSLQEYRTLIERAGLRISGFFQMRSIITMIECSLG